MEMDQIYQSQMCSKIPYRWGGGDSRLQSECGPHAKNLPVVLAQSFNF